MSGGCAGLPEAERLEPRCGGDDPLGWSAGRTALLDPETPDFVDGVSSTGCGRFAIDTKQVYCKSTGTLKTADAAALQHDFERHLNSKPSVFKTFVARLVYRIVSVTAGGSR